MYPILVKKMNLKQGYIRFYVEVDLVDKDVAFIIYLLLNKKSVCLMLLDNTFYF
jgi:hypothetical protein